MIAKYTMTVRIEEILHLSLPPLLFMFSANYATAVNTKHMLPHFVTELNSLTAGRIQNKPAVWRGCEVHAKLNLLFS